MNGLHFEFEWESPLGASGPELRATWAHLVITVNGISVTQVHDYNARSVRNGIYLPLYPLAEWLAMHWWPLLFELETPRRPVYADYAQRHTIRFGREGFALPDLTFRPGGEGKISLDWKSYDLPECGVRFLQQGSTVLKVSEVREAFAALINGVIKRMGCEGIVAVPSLLVILFTLPLTLLIGLLIKFQDRGPLFYGHKRIANAGKEFSCLKFRSMHVDADKKLDAGKQSKRYRELRRTRGPGYMVCA